MILAFLNLNFFCLVSFPCGNQKDRMTKTKTQITIKSLFLEDLHLFYTKTKKLKFNLEMF